MKIKTYVTLALALAFGAAHAQNAAPAAGEPMQQTTVAPVTAAPVVQTAPVTAGQMVERGAIAEPFLTQEEQAFAKQEEELLRQIRIAQMQLELIELQKKMSDSMNTPSQPVSIPMPSDSVIDAPPRDPFILVSVWGDESGLKADLLVKGRRNTVTRGAALPDGWRVASVSESAVEISRGDERRTLTLGGAR